MTDERRPTLLRIVVLTISVLLIVVNLAAAFWHARAELQLQQLREETQRRLSQSGKLQKEFARLSAQVADRYDAEVREFRKLAALTLLVRDRKDFPLDSSDKIVSCVLQDSEADGGEQKIRALVYIPPGEHCLRYSFDEIWDGEPLKYLDYGRRHPTARGPAAEIGWEQNAVTLDLPTDQVHEIEFHVAQVGEQEVLRVAVANHGERTFSLRPFKVRRQRGEERFHSGFPNQHLAPSDEVNQSANVWRRSESVLNEVLYHTWMVESLREQERKRGALRLRCWVESDVPVSVSATAVATHSRKFLRRYMKDGKYTANGPVPNVYELFQPYDGSGNLYYKTPPDLD